VFVDVKVLLQTGSFMSQLAALSWLQFLLGAKFFGAKFFSQPFFRSKLLDIDSESYFKEKALRFGYDIRQVKLHQALSKPWKSFFYEKSLEYTLKGVSCKTSTLSLFEKFYWKKHCRHVESITLSGHTMSMYDASTLFSWLENLKILELYQTNGLVQVHDEALSPPKTLDTVSFKDLHLLDEHAHRFIPDTVRSIHIDQCRSVTLGFFEGLKRLKNLESFTFTRSKSLQAAMLQMLPETLKMLDLSDSADDVDPTLLELLPKNLESLKVNGWHAATGLHLPTWCRKLKVLELARWNLTTDSLQALATLNLEKLNLAHCFLHDALTCVDSLPKTLRKLCLSHNTIDSTVLHSLHRVTGLQTLLLEHIEIHDEFVSMTLSESLQHLSLSYSGPISRASIEAIKNLPNLCVLELAGCSIDNEMLQNLPKTLSELNLCDCTNITDTGIQNLEENAQLHTLLVNGCEQIRGFGLASLTNTLKILSLQGCDRISGKCLLMLPRRLEALYLDRCELISGDDVQMLPKTLQILSLSHCLQVDNSAISFLRALPRLHTLDVRSCPKISQEALVFMIKKKFEGHILCGDEASGTDAVKDCCKDLEQHPASWSAYPQFTFFKSYNGDIQ